PTADVSVRPGIAEDARAIAAIQAAAWRDAYVDVLPAEALASLDVDAMQATWHAALTQPPSARHRMFTACAGPVVAGSAALAPAPHAPMTGALAAMEVRPVGRSVCRGSRLLAPCVDERRQSNASAFRTWVLTPDERRGEFLRSAGLEPSGMRR